MPARIVIDRNIQYGVEAFAGLGDLTALPADAITPDAVRRADALIVRSVTCLNAALLEGSTIAFAGSVTAGIDHVDTAYLAKAGIRFGHAPGCNAESVADYVLAGLLCLRRRGKLSLPGASLGVVGWGQVGSRVADKARGLGLTVRLNDPPIAEAGHPGLLDLDELLACDAITLHGPLPASGRHPTVNLINRDPLQRMRPGSILINTCRGGVVDEEAWKDAIRDRRALAVIDVGANEPRIDPELLQLAELATPHIAGYSADGRSNGTLQVYRQWADFLGLRAAWQPPLPDLELPMDPHPDANVWIALDRLVRNVYNIEADDCGFCMNLAQSAAPETVFEQCRRNYPVRRDFTQVALRLPADADPGLAQRLAALGFKV